jgi:hypothetical protein
MPRSSNLAECTAAKDDYMDVGVAVNIVTCTAINFAKCIAVKKNCRKKLDNILIVLPLPYVFAV